ncbi:hypothetical protein DEJ23_00875 [Curtobacterium sp. MCSS17_008]|uniref:hypothetical protein n=1 Tax=Curtobacterium sp. MCSS17_008 TaxID=2175647 RepID=UPI000DA738FA|nr:hypothetical protein [Curtobacterium sp. MCSS17_008]PZF59625.1 hypothetical protein DEJ23_00875 [Curtobacterium sp. MCSS17_008]
MSPDAGRPADTRALDDWTTLLDALEHELTVTSATEAATTWTQPTVLGPVPRELVGRASRLLAAQRDRLAELETERRQTLEHLGALRQVAATDEPRGSVYLDASA